MDTLQRTSDATERTTEPATFTKWLVGEGPEMTGVVGGVVGEGTYAGLVLELVPGDTDIVAARYEFHGGERSFKALVHVEQTGLDGIVTGVVIDGWRKGEPVRGGYREIKCDHDGVTTDCWQGSLFVGD